MCDVTFEEADLMSPYYRGRTLNLLKHKLLNSIRIQLIK